MAEPVATVVRAGDRRVHRFQVVRERDEAGREWVVVGFEGEAVRLASPDFEWSRKVPRSAVAAGAYEPLVAGDVPVWGY